MSFFDDLMTSETLAGIRTKMVGYTQTAQLLITNWIVGAVGQQIFEFVTNAIFSETQVVAQVIRGFASLGTSTDPGDVDPVNPVNQTLPWTPGALSFLGQNSFGTTRDGPTFPTGSVTFMNGGTGAVTFFPDSLTFTRSTVNPATMLAPTYRNSADPSVYTNVDGSVTIGAGGSITLPITAEQSGSANSALPTTISLTTQPSGGSCSATNPTAILGNDLEDAATYRARCQEAANRLTFSDPQAAYLYFATQNLDGSPLLNASGAPVGINRVWVSGDSSTGIVQVYFASASGLAQTPDVNAANANIQSGLVVIGDAITFTGSSVTTVPITVAGSVSVKNGTGGLSGSALQSAVQNAIVQQLTASVWAQTFPIGGYTQTAGAGFLYTVDLAVQTALAYVGAYDPQITMPSGASTAIGVGVVPLIATMASSWTVTLT